MEYMGSTALVSIILPTYNRVEKLSRAIDSVLAQSYSNWELIIWDDGSTDGTQRLVNCYADDRIRYYYDLNHGVSNARNQAIAVAHGMYLAFLDSDDVWRSEKLTEQVSILDGHPEIEFLFSDFLNNNLGSQTQNLAFEKNWRAMRLLAIQQLEDDLFLIKDHLLESMACENYIATDTVILRRDILKRTGGFNENLRNFEDFELWWRIGLADIRCAYTTRVHMTRYKPAGSLSNLSQSTMDNMIKGLDYCAFEANKRGRNQLRYVLKPLYRNAWQNMISLYGNQGNVKMMINAFFRSLRYGIRLGSFRLLFEAVKLV